MTTNQPTAEEIGQNSPIYVEELEIPRHIGRVEIDFLAEKIDWTFDESPVFPVESMRFYKDKTATICYLNVNKNSSIYPRNGLYLSRFLRVQFDSLTPEGATPTKRTAGPFTIVYSETDEIVLVPKCCLSSLIDMKRNYERMINEAIDNIYLIEAEVFRLLELADMANNETQKIGYFDVARVNINLLAMLRDPLDYIIDNLNTIRRDRALKELRNKTE